MIVDIDGRTVELSDEQVESFHALTKLQRRFVLAALANPSASQTAIYRLAGGKAKTDETARACAVELFSNPNVSRFLERFKLHETEKLGAVAMSREEMIQRLTEMARTKISDVLTITNNPVISETTGEVVAQSAWALKELDDMTGAGSSAITELTAGKQGLTVKLHNQREAMKQLADLLGYNKPQQVEVSGVVATAVTPQQVLDFKKAFNETF